MSRTPRFILFTALALTGLAATTTATPELATDSFSILRAEPSGAAPDAATVTTAAGGCVVEVPVGDRASCSITVYVPPGQYSIFKHLAAHEFVALFGTGTLEWWDANGKLAYRLTCAPGVWVLDEVPFTGCSEYVNYAHLQAGNQRIRVTAEDAECGFPSCYFHGEIRLD